MPTLYHELPGKQQQILDVVRAHIHQRGFAPTVREIGKEVNLSSSCTVKKHLDSLESKGFLRRDRYKRTLELMEGGELVSLGRSVCVPLMGRVAGGIPIVAEESQNPEMLPIPVSLLNRSDQSGHDLFALEVYGDSMRDAGIGNGDIVVARRQSTATDGQIVVARIQDEATVKKFYREAKGFRLEPANPDFAPIYTDEIAIMGHVAMAIKRFV